MSGRMTPDPDFSFRVLALASVVLAGVIVIAWLKAIGQI